LKGETRMRGRRTEGKEERREVEEEK
jgi:hypothetical protein